MAVIQKQVTRNAGADVGMREHLNTADANPATMKLSIEVSHETKNPSTLGPSYATPGIYLKDSKTIYIRDTSTTMFNVALFTITKPQASSVIINIDMVFLCHKE